MKHNIRDSIIFLIDALGISALYRMYQHRQGPLVRVIVFHDVADASWFGEVIAHCVQNYNVLTPADFQAQKFDSTRINILLTFDDGYQSWVDVCAPVLKKHNLKALFFINSGLLDIAFDSTKVTTYMRERLFLSPKAPLTWDGAKILQSHGHTIGGHSVGHYNLAILGQSELEREIIDDKKRIEEQLGITLTDFAYPFGQKIHRTDNILELLTKVGYTSVYTALSGFVPSKHGVAEIPRMCIEKNQPIASVQYWIEGSYDIFCSIIRML